MVLFYRIEAVTLFRPPLLQSPWAHAAIILLSLGFAVLAVLISSCWIPRMLFSWCIEPHWLMRFAEVLLPDPARKEGPAASWLVFSPAPRAPRVGEGAGGRGAKPTAVPYMQVVD